MAQKGLMKSTKIRKINPRNSHSSKRDRSTAEKRNLASNGIAGRVNEKSKNSNFKPKIIPISNPPIPKNRQYIFPFES
jgi:hypothetical protein